MYILPNATEFNNACASESRTVATKCEIYDDITETNVGEVATFDTGVAKPLSTLKVGLTPKQDLNGYDAPWVGGAGKNLYPDASDSGSTASLNYYHQFVPSVPIELKANTTYTISFDYVVTADVSSAITFSVGVGTGSSYNADVATYYTSNYSGKMVGTFTLTSSQLSTYKYLALRFPRWGQVVTNVTWSISNIQLEIGSSATSYAPYSNICPIYPSNGKNLLDSSVLQQGGIASATGAESDSNARVRTPFIFLKGGSYTVSSKNNLYSVFDVYDTNQSYLQAESFTTFSASPKTYTINGDRYVRIVFRNSGGTNITPSEVNGEQLEYGSTATPYVPYQGINVVHTGKNLIPRIFSDGKVPSISTGALVNANNACRSDYIRVESGSVTLSCDNASNRQIYLFLYDSNMAFLTYQSTSGNFVTVTDANGQYAMVRCDGGTTSPNNIQLELGSSATSYEPYNGTTYPILLGRDVYGGTLDVVSGKLVVDKVFKLVDGSSSTGWNRITTYGTSTRFDLSIPDIKYDSGANTLTNMFSKIAIGTANAVGFSVHASSHLFQLQVPTATANTVADLMTYFSANNLQIVYVLDTPLEYNLTTQQIQTLLGTNNIWSGGNAIDEINYFGVTVVMDGDGINGEIISMEWDNIICSNDGLQIGTTCMDEFKMTYRPVSTTMSLMGKEMHPYVGLEFGSPATVTYVPLGVFYVTNSETNDDGYTVNITAYDGMQKLLGDFNATALGVTFPINAWALLTAIATYFDLTVSYDKLTYELLTSDNYTLTTSNGETLLVQQEINANQQAPLNKPLEGTYRDYVGWIVGLVGANAHMGRNGDLWVGRYEDHGFVIGRNVQHMGGAKINYGGSVTYECIVSGTDEEPLYPTSHSGNSITYTNPYITQEELDILNDAIFADGNMVVTPCDVAWRSNPCVDAGDIVGVTDKDGNNSLTYVMERVVRVTGGLAEDLHCYAETEVVHTLNKSPLVTKFAQLTNDIKESVNPIDATKGTFEFIDNGDGTNGGFTIYENGTNSWLRCTAGGLGISADGGLTYTNAITKNGVTASALNVKTNGISVLQVYYSENSLSSWLLFNNPHTGGRGFYVASTPEGSGIHLYKNDGVTEILGLSSYSSSDATSANDQLHIDDPRSGLSAVHLMSSVNETNNAYSNSVSVYGALDDPSRTDSPLGVMMMSKYESGTFTNRLALAYANTRNETAFFVESNGTSNVTMYFSGHYASWQTKTINGVTINYLGY